MIKTFFSLFLIITLSAIGETPAAAQDSTKIPTIGMLVSGSSRVVQPNRAAFLRGLEQLGYVEGKNIRIEYRFANGKRNLLPELAADLVRLKVAVIVPSGPTAVKPAMEATGTIPIVMPNGGDPVERGFVTNLTRPGGNVTGLAGAIDGLDKKFIELLKETMSSATRVVVLIPHERRKSTLDAYKEVAGALGIDVQSVEFYRPEEFDNALAKINALRPDALLIVQNTLTLRYAGQIADFASKNRLPLLADDSRFVKAGALMSLGINYPANWRRAAVFVDKILKRADSATLPVEPAQLELVINLKTAERIGITIPPEILLEASEVIK